MRALNQQLVLIATVLLFAANASAQAPVVYQDEATFLSVVDSPTLIDFEGIAEPGESVFEGNPGLFASNGVVIANNSQMFVQNINAAYGTGSFLSSQGANPQIVQIKVPRNTTAMGFSYSYANYGSLSATASIGILGAFALPAEPPGSMGFFGITLDAGIGLITLTVDGGAIDIDNIWFAVDPNLPPVDAYLDEAFFLESVGSPTLIDFEGIAVAPDESVSFGNPGILKDQGVIFNSNAQMWVRNVDGWYGTGSILESSGDGPQDIQIFLPPNTIAVGFSYSYTNWGSSFAAAEISGSGAISLLPQAPGSMQFAGFTRDTAIDSVTVTVNGGTFDIDNVWFAVDPDGPPPERYRDEAPFLALLDSPTLIDFEGIATVPDESVFFGNPGVLADQGVTFSSNSWVSVRNIDSFYGSGSFLQSSAGDQQIVQILLPANTIAVGFSYGYAKWPTETASVNVDGGVEYELPNGYDGGLEFFGVVQETPVEVVTVTANGELFDIDNVWFLVDPDAPPPEFYRDESAFLDSLDSPTLYDFEGIADPDDPVYLGAPGSFAENGLTVSNNWGMYVSNEDASFGTGSYLTVTGENPAVVRFELPANTVAMGFSYAYARYGSLSATVDVDGSGGYVLPPEPGGGLGFFGVARETPMGVVTVTVDGTAADIDNVWIFVDPGAPRPDFFRNESAFLANVESPTLIDFEGRVDPDASLDFGNSGAIVDSGVRIANEENMFVQNNTWYGTQSYLSAQGADPQSVLIQLPPGTLGFGFFYNSQDATVTVDGSDVYQLNEQYFNQMGFFGVVRDAPIGSIEISTMDLGIDFDNIWLARAPASGAQFNVPGGGEIDTGFGMNGILMIDDLLQSDANAFFGLGVQPGGGIILAGLKANDFEDPITAVARIDSAGILDPTFGEGGIRTVYLGLGGGDVADMQILSDGSILVAGRSDTGTADSTSFVFKLTPDGDLDTAFGNNGIVIENLDPPPDRLDGYERVVPRQDGSILFGTLGLGVHQFSASGIRDMGFGLSGVATPNDIDWGSFGLAEASDGSIIFGGGTAFFSGPQDFILGKYLPDGSALNSSFGLEGIVSEAVGAGNDELMDLIIDDQGRIVAIGYTRQAGGTTNVRTAIARFLPDGQLDPSFGYGGIRKLDGIALRDLYFTKVVSRPDGGLLVMGRAIAPISLPSQEVFVMSLHEDGSLDESFAGKGWWEFDAVPDPAPEDERLSLRRAALAIHPTGKLLLMHWKCYCVVMLEAPDWGASAVFTGIISLDDINGNGTPEIGVAVPGSTRVHVRDGSTDALISDIDFGEDVAFDMAVLPDLDASGYPEIAMLNEQDTGQVRVQIRDSYAGNIVDYLWYGLQYDPVSMDIVSDYNGNGFPEIAVLGSESGTDAVRVQVQDSLTGAFLDNVFLGTQSIASDMVSVTDTSGNGIPEISILGVLKANDQVRSQVWDADTAAFQTNIWFGNKYQPQSMITMPDINSNGSDEIVAVGVDPATQNIRVQVRDSDTIATLYNIWLGAVNEAVDIKLINDINSDGVSDLAVLLKTPGGTGRVRVQSGLDGAFIRNLFYSVVENPVGLAVMPDYSGNGFDELAALGESTGVRHVQILDTSTGSQVNRIDFP